MRLFRRTPRAPHTRVFFATDLHGSERCFRKWLNAAAVYEADALILGGDLSGKVLVPVVAGSGRDAAELDEERARIRMTGRYPIVVTPDEQAVIEADPAALDSRFQQAMEETLQGWVELADERLAGSNVAAFTMLGNDDAPELADVLRSGTRTKYAEDGIVELPGGFEMASCGYSTPTPWDTPRELAEDELAERLTELLDRLCDPARAIVNLHCPPSGTHLDNAAKLDADMRPVVDASGLVMTSVGSTAVRSAIERYQPMLGLHGHVHESPGTEKLGGTLCINPGSDYGDGVLRGAIVDLEAERGVARWQLVQG